MTHKELVHRAERYLMNSVGCGFVFTELSTVAGEIPDAIGFKGAASMLIECKANRADFLSDAKKPFRKRPHLGMGMFRYYMCVPDVIKPEDLPDGWGLLYCRGKSIKRVVCPFYKPNSFPHGGKAFDHNRDAETLMLYSAIRRVHLRGDLQKIYDQSTLKGVGNEC